MDRPLTAPTTYDASGDRAGGAGHAALHADHLSASDPKLAKCSPNGQARSWLLSAVQQSA